MGQEAAQTPQPMQASGSRRQVLAARSTAMACRGHFLAQRVQYTHRAGALTGGPPAAGAGEAGGGGAGRVKVSLCLAVSGGV